MGGQPAGSVAILKINYQCLFKAIEKYKKELETDPVVAKHFASIRDTMFEKELLRLIQPYSCVQVDHIAKCVGLSRGDVEPRLSQMILDKKFSGLFLYFLNYLSSLRMEISPQI